LTSIGEFYQSNYGPFNSIVLVLYFSCSMKQGGRKHYIHVQTKQGGSKYITLCT
jgi:hypothetical protein